MDYLKHFLHSLGPAMPAPKAVEALRAGTGAAIGLGLAAALLWLLDPTANMIDHPLLIAPFGASAFLIFAVPNSPMAQPWSAVLGNSVSALAAILILHAGLPVLPAAALAVMLAVLAMAALRAMHPPGGAVALATVLSAHPDALPGLQYLLLPVASGSLALVGLGIAWAHATGRRYPFRIAPEPTQHGTKDPAPDRRFIPSEQVLAATLTRLRLSANLGVEDLARLIETAETEANASHLGPTTADQMMSRDLIQVAPDTPLPVLAESFRGHRFKTLPVRNPDGSFGGLVSQSALVGRAEPNLTAHQLIESDLRSASPQTPLAELIALLADGGQQAVPVLEANRLVGLITRSDMIALLSGHMPT
ncbi:HPP family protein [Cypionkella psychrotolerans]|uniref:HPP family protein n=1 Tax=Cypionkella psychrotolerans TaxID=1678131 RepID=UPI0006B4F067|nr:HPP family protein [Cypionkella psychrotolerans]